MGVEANIAADRWPKQGKHLGLRTEVVFHYDTSYVMHGTIVRDDAEAPWRLIIRLDDGRFVLASECQYSPKHPALENHNLAAAPSSAEDRTR